MYTLLLWIISDYPLDNRFFMISFRILQKLSNILHPSRQNWTTEVCFFCKRKLIHDNIWANDFSPLTLSWSVSMKITFDSLYYSYMVFSIIMMGIQWARVIRYIQFINFPWIATYLYTQSKVYSNPQLCSLVNQLTKHWSLSSKGQATYTGIYMKGRKFWPEIINTNKWTVKKVSI